MVEILEEKVTKKMDILEGWKEKQLGEVATILNGKAYKQTELLTQGKYKVLRVGNFFTNSAWYYSDLELDENKYVSDGDLMYAWSASFGPRFWKGDKTIYHYHIWKIIPSEQIDKHFLYYYLDFDTAKILDNKQGGTMFHITKGDMEKRKTLLPPLPEQKAIASFLGKMDSVIGKTSQLIAQKELQKKGLMQLLLTGKKRLKGFTDDWKEVRLGDVFDRVTRKNSEANTNVLTISAQRGLINQEKYFNKQIASELLDNYFLLKKGEFAYNKSYSNGYLMGAVKRLTNYEKGVVTTLYICFALKNDNFSADFFEQYFEAQLLVKGLEKIAHEGGRAHGLLNVTPSDFFNLKITIPELAEQNAIAYVLKTADSEISLLKDKLAKQKEQKKGLMQVLLTGKKRLKV